MRKTALLALLLAGPALAQKPPATGRDLIHTMRDAYGNHWFKTLTFAQSTTRVDSTGKSTVTTWYESLRYTDPKGTELRIDFGSPKQGNGVIYTVDSLWAFRAGQQRLARPSGNLLLPLVEGIYVEPVERSLKDLAPTGIDFSKPVLTATWNGQPVWIAGAAAAGDTTSPQFWVDPKSKAVVRALFSPVAGAPFMDMHFTKLVETGGGWLATRCEFYVAGKLEQAEDYNDWKTDVALSPGLFAPATFSTAPHWVKD
ncbi:MAG TPA: hypothetical protein VH163_02580 [Gemmatimonadales bacterium]|jgi:hypothetical protein|nr:hypothetical protein [Gemmatimonadales bacterium]